MTISSKTGKNINRFLLIASILVVMSSIWATLVIVQQIGSGEHHKVKLWASSVQRQAELIEHGKTFFDQIALMERNKLQLWAEAVSRMNFPRSAAEFELYNQIIEENTTIPVIVTDGNLRILYCVNTDIDCSKITQLQDTLLNEFSQYPPISIPFMNNNWYFYYKHSKAFVELQQILDHIVNSFMDEIVTNSTYAPILIVSEDEKTVIQASNVSPERYANPEILKNTLAQMREQNTPIEFSTDLQETYLIFYENSITIRYLAYLPLLAFVVFGIFIWSVIWGTRMSRQSENNKLWVGMSRETAHQLGTPLSSLMGWAEYLKNQNIDKNHLAEMQKDISRLTVISERFSKIGSLPEMASENIVQVVYKSIAYLQPRLSQKIKLQVNVPSNAVMLAKINVPLVDWVLENLVINATNAIGIKKEGLIELDFIEGVKTITINVTDNGKGIPKKEWKKIFDAGYTTKSRGWGLGLPLCYRIIHTYHNGDIFVKKSVVGEGTTMQIILNK
ncbi:MAG: HAMP domain-containing histidine kinase [Bacteroidales bacterium]|nr:HAMP domain-containing histidine kinase [Bacteroidales bacterium]